MKAFLANVALRMLGLSVNAYALVYRRGAGAWALDLFTVPRARKSRTHDPVFLETAEHHLMANGKGRISSYSWSGEGPTVLLAHGWESNASRWRPLVRLLRRHGFNVIALDAPAHGRSGSERFSLVLYAGFLEEVSRRFQPVAIIGHSAGGMASAYLLSRGTAPSIRHLILMATPSELHDLMDTFRKLLGMNDRVFQALQDTFVERYDWQLSAFSVPRFVQRIDLPGLIIHDRKDDIAPYAGALEIHRQWPASQLITTDGQGHSLDGEQVTQAILSYLVDHL